MFKSPHLKKIKKKIPHSILYPIKQSPHLRAEGTLLHLVAKDRGSLCNILMSTKNSTTTIFSYYY